MICPNSYIVTLKNNPDSARRFLTSEINQELYIQITNKLGNLIFSIDRIENNETYQSNAYYEDVLIDIRQLEELENKFKDDWNDALKRAIQIFECSNHKY